MFGAQLYHVHQTKVKAVPEHQVPVIRHDVSVECGLFKSFSIFGSTVMPRCNAGFGALALYRCHTKSDQLIFVRAPQNRMLP